MTMEGQRLVLDEQGAMHIESFVVEPPTDHQIVVRVACSQISAGSEMNVVRQRRQIPGATGPGASRTLGYTTVGRILARGCCGHRLGDWRTCSVLWQSWVSLDHHAGGGWSRGDVLPNQNLVERVPETLTTRKWLSQCWGMWHSMDCAARKSRWGESVAVHGLGTVGLLALQLARRAGAYPVIGVDVVDARLALAQELGATHVVNAAREDVAAVIHDLTRLPRTWTGWLPTVVPAQGPKCKSRLHPTSRPIAPCWRRQRTAGRLVMVGAAQHEVAIGAHELLRREITVRGSYQTGQLEPHPYWPWTRARNRAIVLGMIARGDLQVQPLISHVASYTDAAAIYRMLEQGNADDWLSVFFTWE